MAQSEKDSSSISRHTIFFEILGSGFPASLNYDIILIYKESIHVSGRVGGFLFPRGSFPLLTVPIEVNFSVNIGKELYMVLGAGLSYIWGGVSCSDCTKLGYNSSTLFTNFRVGIKYQKKSGGIFFSAGLTPLIRIHEFNDPPVMLIDEVEVMKFLPMVGIGAGYTFKKRNK